MTVLPLLIVSAINVILVHVYLGNPPCEPPNPLPSRSSAVVQSRDQLYERAKKKKNAENRKPTAERKAKKLAIKLQEKLKWEKLGGGLESNVWGYTSTIRPRSEG